MALPVSTTPASTNPGTATLRDLLTSTVANGASDLHVRSGVPPLIRVSGELWPLDLPVLTPDETEALVDRAFPTPEDRESFRVDHECDFALTEDGVGRFRVNAYRSRGTAAMVLRHVKEQIPTFDELGLPRVAHDLALRPSGLVLVCGPTGSGKTTSLAAMVNAINAERRCHILTIEDPIEFLHRNQGSTISQRELHTDTLEFSRALRSGMRQDPDVILIGEIRDRETMRTALQAAETGHLVLASLHARTVVDAINRVIL
jgi:twitching motility protein PilT